MNILPKKSWHVRNRDNVARVRRDEELAAAAGSEAGRRAALAEQQARTDFLRKRARLSVPDDTQGPLIPPVGVTPLHLDLFSGLEGVKEHGGGSTEHREEMRQEKERRERSLGILTYLGQSSAEAQTHPPWYTQPPAQREGQGEAQPSLKGLMDPLVAMKEMLRGEACKEGQRVRSGEERGGRGVGSLEGRGKRRVGSQEERRGRGIGSQEGSGCRRIRSGAEREGREGEAGEKLWGRGVGSAEGRGESGVGDWEESRGRGVGSAEGRGCQRVESGAESRGREGGAAEGRGCREGGAGEGTGSRGTRDLRQERLRREAAERSRALALLRGAEGVSGAGDPPEGEREEAVLAYHSQFHPELSRQHRNRRR